MAGNELDLGLVVDCFCTCQQIHLANILNKYLYVDLLVDFYLDHIDHLPTYAFEMT